MRYDEQLEKGFPSIHPMDDSITIILANYNAYVNSGRLKKA